MEHLRFNLNGAWVEERAVSPTTTLLRYLRDHRHQTGTKEGCAEGDCGACTVAIAELDQRGEPTWRAVNSCLVLLPMVQGKHVVTVEALKQGEQYHPAQVAMAKALGSQCGYCTPGIVMSMFEATYRADLDAPWKLDDQLCGNLCRCTGYRPIRDAAKAVAGSCPADAFKQALRGATPQSMELRYEAAGQRFVTPTTLTQLWDELDAHPDARFVVGGTDLSLEVTKKFAVLPKLVSLEGLSALKKLAVLPDGGVRLGSGASISDVEAFSATRLPSLHRMVRYFGARQIKHRGTVGGNLCTASPIGDLAPALISLGATAVMEGRGGERRVPLEQFFVGYRKTALAPKELLTAVEVPAVPPSARAVSYKVSKRRELDISAVAAGFVVVVDDANKVVLARLALGGMAATPKRAQLTETALEGQLWTEENVDKAAANLDKDFTPLTDHRGSAWYRQTVCRTLLRGFYLETLSDPVPALPQRPSATVHLELAAGE